MHLDRHHTYKNCCHYSSLRRAENVKDMRKNLEGQNKGSAKGIVDL